MIFFTCQDSFVKFRVNCIYIPPIFLKGFCSIFTFDFLSSDISNLPEIVCNDRICYIFPLNDFSRHRWITTVDFCSPLTSGFCSQTSFYFTLEVQSMPAKCQHNDLANRGQGVKPLESLLVNFKINREKKNIKIRKSSHLFSQTKPNPYHHHRPPP